MLGVQAVSGHMARGALVGGVKILSAYNVYRITSKQFFYNVFCCLGEFECDLMINVLLEDYFIR